MKRIAKWLAAGSLAVAAGSGVAAPEPAPRAPELAFQLVEGQNINAFVRDGATAAHLLLRNGTDPRILVAFPAGNSGVGLWFDSVARGATWRLDRAPQPLTLADAGGRPLYGIRAVASIDAARLSIKQAVLSNVRFLRDYQAVGHFPAEIATAAQIGSDRIVFARDRADGAPGYRLELQVLEGRIENGAILASGGRIRLAITAASGDRPLTGLTQGELLNSRAAADPAARNALRFLSYREKFLAGSWRFNTYFGRDTLMSVRLLMPVLQPPAIEAGIGAVLARLDRDGEVAHEEGLSEFAVVDHRQHGGGSGDAATLDYGMIDDDYMLAPVAAEYLLAHADAARARAFLARAVDSEAHTAATAPAGAALVRNLRFVIAQATPFAAKPDAARLLAIKPGRSTGQWRDSDEGLGRGRYPYDVNAVFVPAALEAGARLLAAGLLDPYLSRDDRTALARAAAMAAVWRDRAPGFFRVETPAATAAPLIRGYAARVGVPAGPAIAALGSSPLVFNALSLDADRRPVPIINSDIGFALLFGTPSSADLETYVGAVARPFPAGLMTDVGLLVANAALTAPVVQDRFAPTAYHGAVVWSWQQALLAAGLERQLARRDLSATTRTTLLRTQAQLWRAIGATRSVQSSELWSWSYAGGRYAVVPFGAGKRDVDESNAAQLWSTVYLAVQPPRLSARPGTR